MADPVLSQEEIDSVFRNARGDGAEKGARQVRSFDFRRPDRIAKEQLRAIYLLHENFARSFASSLSAYLRAYVVANLVSVEQLSFKEFSHSLLSPTCLATLSMEPFDSMAVLEINPALTFPLLEMLLGGNGKMPAQPNRKITEVEESVLECILRLLLNDLRTAWQGVAEMKFKLASHETEPQLLQILAPNEAIVAIGMDVRVGDSSGMINLAIPSMVVKMLRNRFDQQWSLRRNEATEAEQARILGLIQPARLHLDARLQGPTLLLEDLLRLSAGDVLVFDHRADRSLDLLVNGVKKYEGRVAVAGQRRVFRVSELGEGD